MIVSEELLNEFEPVTLKELDKVALLNRIDIKYVFNSSLLKVILRELVDHYYILEIDGARTFNYSTMYYDTSNTDMYIDHVRGKLNRFKVRHREYVDSGISYLEIKFKNNKNRTIKWRTKEAFTDDKKQNLNDQFLKKYVPYKSSDLEPALQNAFNRITLVDKGFTQRVTLDFKLEFNPDEKNGKDLHQIAIAELKIDKSNKNNVLQQVLRKYKIQPSGFSKYCVGKTMTETTLCKKSKNLKPKIRRINKIANNNIDNK